MDEMKIGGCIDAASELEALLKYNDFSFRREGTRFRLIFSEQGRKWETECECRDRLVLIYARYPFPVGKKARDLCERINRQVVLGSMFLWEDRAVFRVGVDLFDEYSAYEHIGRALEYSAGVVSKFWNEMASCGPQ